MPIAEKGGKVTLFSDHNGSFPRQQVRATGCMHQADCSRPAQNRQVCIVGNIDVHLRWPLVGPMQRQFGFLTVSWYISAKV